MCYNGKRLKSRSVLNSAKGLEGMDFIGRCPSLKRAVEGMDLWAVALL